MDPRLIKYAERNAPRYTSYPTAPHFVGDVDGDVFRRWLGELEERATLSLYLHTPYCRQMCWYCGCHAFAAKRDEPIADFVEALVAEIDLVAAATTPRDVREIHWGGGTPNILSATQFQAVSALLADRFDLQGLERHAVEIDPRLLTKAQTEAFAAAGVNRVSLGVQDLDERVQHAIGRIQPIDVVERAAGLLREAGVDALSFDLMYGLPGQTVESVTRTAERAAALKPARFSVFGYAHVPWFKSRQKLMDEAALPGTELRLELADAIRAALERTGYVAIGYDHFALPDDSIAVAARSGSLGRNFQGFVESACDALIGLGPSAISTLPQGYAQNEPEIGAWMSRISGGAFATKRGRALTLDDVTRRDLIMRLLCEFQVDLEDFGGGAAFANELRYLQPLARDGLVRIDGTRLCVPDAARPFARLVAEAFDAYRNEGQARHSKAV